MAKRHVEYILNESLPKHIVFGISNVTELLVFSFRAKNKTSGIHLVEIIVRNHE